MSLLLTTISASSSDQEILAAFQTGAFYIDRVDAGAALLEKAEEMFASGAYKEMGRDGWRGYFPSDLEVTNPLGGLPDSKVVCKFGGGGDIKSPIDTFFNSPNIYPAIEGFEPAFHRFTAEMRHTIREVYAMAERVFGIQLLHVPFVNLSNTIKYAASTNPVGIGEHTDYETLAVVMAAEGTAADLQVLLHGEWNTVEVAEKPVVLVGELLELLTQGRAPAAPHRVVVHPKGTDRHSMTFFTLPDLNTFIDLTARPKLTVEKPER